MMKQLAFAAFLVSIPCMVFAACSSSSSGGNTTPSNDAATGSDTSVGPGSEAGTDAAVPAETWTWIPVAGNFCRDGSTTGIGVNINPNSTKVMIFMEGGGACFNSTTCSTNPATYGESDFNTAVAGASATAGFNGSFASGGNGIMSRGDTKNPVADWSYVYIPYCTGDIHGGNTTGTVTGVTGTQKFVGYQNVTNDLAVIKAMLPNTTNVLLAGMSGGGFGVAVNYEQVADAYGTVPVTMIDDSGPPMADPYLPACLQTEVVTLWGLDKTVLTQCGADCAGDGGAPDDAHFGINLITHLGKKYPTRVLGLMDSEGDGTISSFFGFGADNCTSFSPELAGEFTAGLVGIRSAMSFDANFGSFYFTGVDHTSLEGQLDTREAGDAGTGDPALSDWLTQMIAGTVTNVGP